ncbi:hypothetical protein [Chitinophaga defluvii]|uniref:Uncharacterized protein n=1 Tax=Chitinophaga defluvii TaxID=3163343 RepID=A0ABV2TCE4_9BACT
MKKTKIFLTAALFVAAIAGAYASSQRSFTYTYYVSASETGTTGQVTINDACPNLERGCIKPIPALGNQLRQLFIEQDGVLVPVKP